MPLYRCPLGPLLGLVDAHDVSTDEWSTLVFRDLRIVASNEFGQNARLRDFHHDSPKWVTDIILHPKTWKAVMTKAKENDPTNACDEDMFDCGHNDRAGAPVAFPLDQNFFEKKKKEPMIAATRRMRAWSSQCGAISSRMLVFFCLVCCKHIECRSPPLDHAQYRGEGCRDKILSSQPAN